MIAARQAQGQGAESKAARPAIVMAAFGSTRPAGLADLNALDGALRAHFVGCDLCWAFTSRLVVARLKATGVATVFDSRTPLLSLDEVYQDLVCRGTSAAVVQCALVMQGHETRLVRAAATRGLRVVYGEPLLSDAGAIAPLVSALASEFGGGDVATILCGHGNARRPAYNALLVQLDAYVRANYPRVYLATVEGPPGAARAIAAARASGAAQARFVPLMFTAGDHMENDVMGDAPDSWRMQVGLPATYAAGMASNPAIAGLLIAAIEKLLAPLETQGQGPAGEREA